MEQDIRLLRVNRENILAYTIKNIKEKKIYDFYVLENYKIIPNIERYVYKTMKKSLESATSKHYTNLKYKATLLIDGISFDNKRISIKNSNKWSDLYNKLSEYDLLDDIILLGRINNLSNLELKKEEMLKYNAFSNETLDYAIELEKECAIDRQTLIIEMKNLIIEERYNIVRKKISKIKDTMSEIDGIIANYEQELARINGEE